MRDSTTPGPCIPILSQKEREKDSALNLANDAERLACETLKCCAN